MSIKVGSEEWNRRYDSFSAALGFGPHIGLQMNPAYEAFCLAELELFDGAMGSFKSDSPLIMSFVEDLRACIADPLYSGFIIKNRLFPILKKNKKNKEDHIKLIDEKQGDVPDYAKDLVKDARDKFSLTLKSINSIIKKEEEFENYFSFNTNLIRASKRNYENRLILASPNVVMANLRLRNELYREVLDPNKRHLLGYGPLLLTQAFKQNTLENSLRLSEYRKMLSEDPELVKLFEEKEVTVAFLGSSEERKMNAREVYEELLPSRPTLTQFSTLEGVVSSHFNRRREDVFSRI